MDERRPVLVGVGQVRGNRERTAEGAREPLELLLDAVRAADADATGPHRRRAASAGAVPGGAGPDRAGAEDRRCGTGATAPARPAGSPPRSGVHRVPGAPADRAGRGFAPSALLAAADSVAVVKVVSWAYRDLAARVAQRIGAAPSHLHDTTVGGHWPALLLERAAAAIAAGESRVALIAGAEAQASATALRRAGVDPVEAGWSAEPGGPPSFEPGDLGSPAMQAAGLILPTRVYPLFESALRHARGETPAQAACAAAELYAGFSRVAADNAAAWNPQARSAGEIATTGPGNRMVCEPYPLAVNAMPQVDQAAAVIVTSLRVAREHGISEDRIVHVRGGAGAADAADVLARPSFASSAALADVLDRACPEPAELDLIDVYSCFPVVPKLVAAHLGLPLGAVTGVTGGHSAFGGPLSSYTLHALVAVTQRLRTSARLALVHGNGGYLTHQHALLLARDPHPDGYTGDPSPRDTAGPAPLLVAVPDSAQVTVETATVEYGRDGTPAQGFLVGRTADGGRFAAATAPGDAASATALSTASGREIVGRTVRATGKDGHVVVEEASRP